jgi:hypothetical protein
VLSKSLFPMNDHRTIHAQDASAAPEEQRLGTSKHAVLVPFVFLKFEREISFYIFRDSD